MSVRHQSFWPAIFALAVGSFAIGTGEFIIMGLLPELALSLSTTVPIAGSVVSAYAIGVIVGAPFLAVLTAKYSRVSLLIALMAFYAIGGFASAAATTMTSMWIIRIIAGLPHATYFGVAALVATRLEAANKRASAVGWVMTGLAVAAMIGVPIGTWIGQQFGWRLSLILVGVLSLLACVLIHRNVPPIDSHQEASPLRELGALANLQVWLILGIAAIGFAGMFTVFTYIKPLLTEVAGLSVGKIPFVLTLFGAGMVVGNIVGTYCADKSLTKTIGGVLVWSAAVLFTTYLTMGNAIFACVDVFLLGTLVALGPALQVRLMEVAGSAQTLAAALNHSAFNLANAIGAWIGGVVIIAGFGWASTAAVGALFAIAGLVVFAISLVFDRRFDQRKA